MKCTSCGKENTNNVKFPCPKCGKEILRCDKCRSLSVKYNCNKCGYIGS